MIIKDPIEQLKQSEKKKARGRKYEKDRQEALRQLKRITGTDTGTTDATFKKKSGLATKKIGGRNER